jgi:hypothetical protein
MEATTGTSILGGDTVWYPGEDNNFYHSSNNRKPIVAVCLDASGTAIAAIDEAGNCAIWTVKYSLQYRSTQLLAPPQQQPPSPRQPPPRPGNVLTKFIWKK